MILCEAMYGKGCITPVNWDSPVYRVVFGPEMLKEMEQEIVKIRQSLKATPDRQKSYTYLKGVHKQFKIEDPFYL